MKTLIFICTLPLVAFAIYRDEQLVIKLGSDNSNYTACLRENHMSDAEMFTIQDVLQNKHEQPENREKVKTIGCVMKCILQRMEVMKGSEYVKDKWLRDFTKKTNIQPGEKRYKVMENCINTTNDIADACEKSFAFMKCVIKAEKNDPSLNPIIKRS